MGGFETKGARDMKLSVKGCSGCLVATIGLFFAVVVVSRFAGDEAARGVLYLLFFMVVWHYANKSKRRQLSEMSDDETTDAESGSAHCAESQCASSMPALVDGVLVREVEAIASKLESSGIRFSIERSGEDRSFVYGGHGGTGTLMRVRVDPSDFNRAVKILDELDSNCATCHIEGEGGV